MGSMVSCLRLPPCKYSKLSLEEPAIPANAISQNIGHILGTNTSAFELLVLKRKIMGPCWITIKNPQVEHKGVS
jgi:DNA polymerase alpha subunit A